MKRTDYVHENPTVIYISENIPTQETADSFNEQFSEGCDCENVCTIQNECGCLLRSGGSYNVSGNTDEYIFQISSLTKPIYECNANCKCTELCGNKLVQFGPRHALQIQQCRKGLGLMTTSVIKQGNFICEYAGEVITESEAIKRHTLNEKHKLMNYIFCVNEHFGARCARTFIDPSMFGNVGRYINHSCEPNCELFLIRVNNIIPKVCIFAKKTIEAGCELTFDYGSGIEHKTVAPKRRVECLCNSKQCRKFLPFSVY